MKKILLLTTVILAFNINSFEQLKNIEPLHVGDTMPDLIFEVNKGNDVSTIRLNDYRGKLILLDFWGINCASCIAGMPHMLELQQQFKDRLQVFLVTQDKGEDIRKGWTKLAKRLNSKIIEAEKQLPFIEADTVLTKMFPIGAGIPMHVWIDPSQIYRASAYNNTTTAENIQAFLEGKKVRWATYLQPDIGRVELKSWINQRIGFADHLLSYSFVTKFDEKVMANGSSRVQIQKDSATNKNIGLNCFNLSILELYRTAYFKYYGKSLEHNLLLEVRDPEKYYPPKDNTRFFDWQSSNTYCYALKIQPTQPDDVFYLMKRELDQFFQLESKMENRRVRCLILKRISAEDKIHSKGGVKAADRLVDKNDNRRFIIHNSPMSSLFQEIYYSYVSSKLHDIPFIDETNYKNTIDIELVWGQDNYSIPALRKLLQVYGLDIVEEYRDMDVLVIKDLFATKDENKRITLSK